MFHFTIYVLCNDSWIFPSLTTVYFGCYIKRLKEKKTQKELWLLTVMEIPSPSWSSLTRTTFLIGPTPWVFFNISGSCNYINIFSFGNTNKGINSFTCFVVLHSHGLQEREEVSWNHYDLYMLGWQSYGGEGEFLPPVGSTTCRVRALSCHGPVTGSAAPCKNMTNLNTCTWIWIFLSWLWFST